MRQYRQSIVDARRWAVSEVSVRHAADVDVAFDLDGYSSSSRVVGSLQCRGLETMGEAQKLFRTDARQCGCSWGLDHDCRLLSAAEVTLRRRLVIEGISAKKGGEKMTRAVLRVDGTCQCCIHYQQVAVHDKASRTASRRAPLLVACTCRSTAFRSAYNYYCFPPSTSVEAPSEGHHRCRATRCEPHTAMVVGITSASVT